MTVLKGTARADLLLGNGLYNAISGLGGDDTLVDGALAAKLRGVTLTGVMDAIRASDTPVEALYKALSKDLVVGQTDGGHTALRGGSGDDILISTGGADTIYGGNGTDIAVVVRHEVKGDYTLDYTPAGLHGSDGLELRQIESLVFFSGDGNDRLNGTRGNDAIDGDDGNDFLFGAGGDDILKGGRGADNLNGAAGDDELKGGVGDDTLRGGDGDDVLAGEAGNDLLIGGAGADRIELASGEGSDTILGFDVHEDLVRLDKDTGLHSWADVQAAMVHVNGGVALALGGGAVAIFRGVTLAELSESNFLFG